MSSWVNQNSFAFLSDPGIRTSAVGGALIESGRTIPTSLDIIAVSCHCSLPGPIYKFPQTSPRKGGLMCSVPAGTES